MSCRYPEERLALFVEGDLPRNQAADVGRHLQGCAECRDTAAHLRESLLELKALAQPGAAFDEDLHWRVVEELKKQEATQGFRARTLFAGFRSQQALAAALLLVICIGGLALTMPWASKTLEPEMVQTLPASSVDSLPTLEAESAPPAPISPEPPRNAPLAAAPTTPPADNDASTPLMVKMLTDDPNVVIYWFVEPGGSDVSSF